jgi:hypothetical protein
MKVAVRYQKECVSDDDDDDEAQFVVEYPLGVMDVYKTKVEWRPKNGP